MSTSGGTFCADRPQSYPQPRHVDLVRSVEDMQQVTDRLLAQMTSADYSERDLFSVRLVLEEAIVNAMLHGHKGDPSKSVRVSYSVTAEEVVAEVEDEGPGFDPQHVPDPLSPENLERPSGRGLFLMRHYTSWVKFSPRGNCVTLCRQKKFETVRERQGVA